jgi:proline racemase
MVAMAKRYDLAVAAAVRRWVNLKVDVGAGGDIYAVCDVRRADLNFQLGIAGLGLDFDLDWSTTDDTYHG